MILVLFSAIGGGCAFVVCQTRTADIAAKTLKSRDAHKIYPPYKATGRKKNPKSTHYSRAYGLEHFGEAAHRHGAVGSRSGAFRVLEHARQEHVERFREGWPDNLAATNARTRRNHTHRDTTNVTFPGQTAMWQENLQVLPIFEFPTTDTTLHSHLPLKKL